MLTLNDGRIELWQWDTGRKLSVDADCSQVHFSNKVFGRSIDVDVIDGVAIIPDILLQTDKELNAWAFVGTAENGYTKISKTFKVKRRKKPSDYVFTPPEQTSLEEIKEKIEYLESNQDPDAIKNAVDDYLTNNPIMVKETDPTVPEWAKAKDKPSYTAAEVGALPVGTEIPTIDPTLTQSGKAADAKAVGDALANISGGVTVEPAEDDIPKVYWTGDLPTSKDEGDIQGVVRYKSKTADFQYPATLKVQGGSSVNYAKKNFTLKPYKDSTFESKKKLAFKNWPEMNKFVLKAHWIDHSHVRNVGTAKLWGKVVASRSDYNSLPEELRNAPNNGATDGFTVKVFANGVYQGLYEWIVPKDKLFGQDKDIATHSILNSEWNNQPTCAFATTSPTMSGNWSEELQDSLSSGISTSFANLIKFVAGSTDEEFVANAENYFDVQSVIDFDIFARVLCIVDNLCRNQIFFTYDGTKWYEGCWDVDAVLGLPPTTRGFFAYNTEFQTGYIAYKDHGVTNLLYQRVENLFLDRFKARYAELRSDVLSIENILDVYERLTDVITTYDGLLAEDFASTTGGGAFTGIPYTSENNIQQIRAFLSQRIPYMDEVIENMTGETGGGEVEPDIPDEPDQPDTPVTYGNLISVSDFKNAYINYNTGALASDASGNMISTETYIEVVPGVTYIADCFADGIMESAQVGVRYYDANKTYTKDYFGADGIYCPKTFTVPTDKNIKYARLQFVLNGAFKDSSYTGVNVSLFRADDALRCNGITLSESELTFDSHTRHTLTATVSPEGCLDRILWNTSDPFVAKVSNGMVTIIGGGNAVITATCGEQSAVCMVSVDEDVPANRLYNAEFGYGYVSYLTGAYVSNTNNVGTIATKSFVEVEEGATYTVNCTIEGNDGVPLVGVRYFDAEETYTEEYFGEANYPCPVTFTVPTGKNIKYLKLQFVLEDAFTDATFSNVTYSLYKV